MPSDSRRRFDHRSNHPCPADDGLGVPIFPAIIGAGEYNPAALPVLFRLWRGKGTASQVELAAEMLKDLAPAFPGRMVHGVGDAAFAVLSGPKPPPTDRRGRPAEKGK